MAALTPSQPRSIPAVTLAHTALLAPIKQCQSATFCNNDSPVANTIISQIPCHSDWNQAQSIGKCSQRLHFHTQHSDYPQSSARTATHCALPCTHSKQPTMAALKPPTWQTGTSTSSHVSSAHVGTRSCVSCHASLPCAIHSIARLLAVVNAVSPYPVLCFNVGAHVDEVAGNACAAVDSGLMQKCAILPTTRWHGLLDRTEALHFQRFRSSAP